MRRKTAVVTAATALVLPALAIAEVGPHSTWYATNKHANGTQNAINIVVQRNKGIADINGANFCLGFAQFGPGGGKKSPASFDAYPVRVSHGRIHFKGKVKVYAGMAPKQLRMQFTATLRRKNATGSVKFSGTKCGTINFTAPVAQRTK